jgi:LysR family hydrogen peroxide-inducible transcriptional activator
MRLLLLEEGHCFRDQALSFCNGSSPSLPREVLDASSLSTLVQMVGAGLGVTLIPEMAMPVETRRAPVSVARFREPQPSRTIGMIWRKRSPLGRQLRELSEVVRRSAAALRDEAGGQDPRTPVIGPSQQKGPPGEERPSRKTRR